MARSIETALQELGTALRALTDCDPTLTDLLDRIDRGDTGIPSRWADKLEGAIGLHNQLRDVAPKLAAEQQRLQRRGDDYRDRLRASENTARQLTETVSNERQRLSDLQIHVAAYQDDIQEQEQTIRELRAQLRAARRQSATVSEGFATSPTHLNPNTAAGQGRPSSDSGFSEGSTSTEPGERTRHRLAESLFREAVADFHSGDFRKADASFTQVQSIIAHLPAALRSAFGATELAYYRAVCQAETSSDAAAETALSNFLQTHNRASDAQKALVEHLLARTNVKLGRVEQAAGHSCAAVGLWYDIDQASEHYLNAVALLSRIYALRGELANAAAVINQAPAERRDYVRNKYADLRPSTTSTAARQPPTTTTIRPPVAAHSAQTAAAARPHIILPTRPAGPAIRPVVPAPSSLGSVTTSSSVASRRRRQARQLPWLFRAALT
ncbi:hypothetical protein LTR85_011515 [Meristemomyces frigidus]|nr:hypothetical protein LTR85_011515 [Meristemomyces frigidus]